MTYPDMRLAAEGRSAFPADLVARDQRRTQGTVLIADVSAIAAMGRQ